jgi:toxin ParE1/3/4
VTLKIIVRPAAEEDLDEAAAWYEKQQGGLGKEFLASVDEAFAKLQDWPDFGIPVHKELRRANLRRFPYGVFYLVEAQRIVIVGVLHGRRSPRVWKLRLK